MSNSLQALKPLSFSFIVSKVWMKAPITFIETPQLKVRQIRISHSLIRQRFPGYCCVSGMLLFRNEGSLKITSPVHNPHGSFQPSFVAYNVLGRLYTMSRLVGTTEYKINPWTFSDQSSIGAMWVLLNQIDRSFNV